MYQRTDRDGLTHHSDRGVQYLSVRYTERLAEAGIEGSVGSTGDSYDDALAESLIGLYKTEVIRHRGPSAVSTKSNTLPWNGSTGSTIDGCWNRMVTGHRSNWNSNMMKA